jgi:hypothetical protein
MAQIILLTAIDFKIVAILIKTAAIIMIDSSSRSVVIEEGVVMYVAHRVLPE